MTNAKELNERWIQAFNERDWETERACRTDDYLAHMSGAPGPLDNDGWSGFMAMFTSALPDARITIDSAVEEGDRRIQPLDHHRHPRRPLPGRSRHR